MKIPIGIVDDHQLFLKSLGLMIATFNDFSVVTEALNGKDLQLKMQGAKTLPAIMLIDVNMPVMDGIETALWLNEKYPSIKLVALSMNDNDSSVIAMIRAGCCAYILKDTHPNELEKALKEIHEKGHYNSDVSNINYRRLLLYEQNEAVHISDKEKEFLNLVSKDLPYREIAERMNISERTAEGHREALFKKLKVQTKLGLVLEAMKRGLVKL